MTVSCALGAGEQGNRGPTGVARPDMRLSRDQRISESCIFREAFDSGRQFAGRCLVLWLREGDDASLRLGVVASKKTFRRSVDRSRARRLLREAYRLNRFRFSGRKDVVLLARRRILEASRMAVEKDLLEQAGKAGLLAEAKA